MAVVVVIVILLGLLSSALIRARDRANAMRISAEKKTLAAAIETYRHEYDKWPGQAGNTVQTDPNYHVVNCLHPDTATGAENPRGIVFLNRGEYRFDGQGNVLYGRTNEYSIVIDLTNGTVTVEDD